MPDCKKPVEGTEPLSDADLTDVAGGVEILHVKEILCPQCGAVSQKISPVVLVHYKCPKCGKRFNKLSWDVKTREYDVTIDGNSHTVSGEF